MRYKNFAFCYVHRYSYCNKGIYHFDKIPFIRREVAGVYEHLRGNSYKRVVRKFLIANDMLCYADNNV